MKFLPLLLSLILLAPAAVAIAAEEAPVQIIEMGEVSQPTLGFYVERRMFYVPRVDESTSKTLTLDHWKADLNNLGFDDVGEDEATGRPYLKRNSAVTIIMNSSQNLIYREAVMYGESASSVDLFPLRDLEIPLTTEPRNAMTPILSLHPLGFIDPDFQRLRDLLEPVGQEHETEVGFREHVTPQMIYRIWEDPESKLVREIKVYLRDGGGIIRHIRFGEYYQAPSGRIIPRTASSRTFLKDENLPVAELRFSYIHEKEEVKK